jgi:hypothetical protein
LFSPQDGQGTDVAKELAQFPQKRAVGRFSCWHLGQFMEAGAVRSRLSARM